MTEQIRDRVVLQQSEYILETVEGSGLFDPSDFGVTPTRTSTANWRGFVCTYAVSNSRLVLRELNIGLRGPGELHLRDRQIFTAEPERGAWGGWRFGDLEYPIPFTGELRVVKDWVPGFFKSNLGVRPLFTYATVLELRFQDGRLLATNDRSEEMRKARDRRGSATEG